LSGLVQAVVRGKKLTGVDICMLNVVHFKATTFYKLTPRIGVGKGERDIRGAPYSWIRGRVFLFSLGPG